MGSLGTSVLLVFSFTLSFLFLETHQLQSSQTQVLLQLKKHLEFPKGLEIWLDHGLDFCSLSPTPQLNLTCQGNVVTELRIVGDKKPIKLGKGFEGFAIPGETLSEGFSVDSFFTTLARLNTLRSLGLVSLGIWGPIHDKIHRLDSLESLDLSSNYLCGSVPAKISEMVKLRSLVMDDNFLNGSVPGWFGSLAELRVLSLKNNLLTGSFPSSLQRVESLTNLTLSGNGISGKLPDLGPMKSLYMLDLRGNRLASALPLMPKGLAEILLSNNSFSGEIPRQYGDLKGLRKLDLSSNSLRGSPPSSLFSLPFLGYLNLASNALSGSISGNSKCGEKLEFVDLSDNKLTGELPPCLSTESDKRTVKASGNCLATNPENQNEESRCREAGRLDGEKSGGKKSKAGIMFVILGIVALSALFLLGIFVLCRIYCSRGISEQHLLRKTLQERPVAGFASELSSNANFLTQAANLSKHGLTVCRSFSLEEIVDATNNFESSAFLGEGSYGKLYKGRLQNGTQVAIRCLPLSKKFSIRNVKLRLDLLSKLQHQHLACLLGHCLDSGGRGDYNMNKVYLISEFVPNGTFRDHLSEKSPGKALNWSERLAVLIGVAKAVHFLHTGIIPGFFNNRLRANNVLLDQHRMPKLSDFGLSIISEGSETCVGIADKNKSWQMIGLEDDAYSFGFIILEALVGPSLASTREAFLLKEMVVLQNQDTRARVIEPVVLATASSQESVSIAVSIMQKCISPDASQPSFEDILWNLQYAAQVQTTADRELRSDTSSYL